MVEWKLSAPQLALVNLATALGLPKPELEHRFHPERRWRFDLAWPDRLIGVEVDGGVWSRGRHTRGAGFEKDCEKLNEAALLGWRVLRFTPGQIKRGEAIRTLERVFAKA